MVQPYIKTLAQKMLLIWLSLIASVASAQSPKINPKILGVDTIKTTQRLLFGFVLNQRPDGSISCAIDRAWLEATYPELATELTDKEKKSQLEVKDKTVRRIKEWLNESSGESKARLRIFLEDQLERIQSAEFQATQTTFVTLDISSAEIVKVTPCKPEQRRIAGVAYQHELPDVTTTSTAILDRRLKEKGVDAKTETFDLTGKLPKLIIESDRQWAVRQALVEYEIVQQVELQGKGNMLMGSGDPIDAMAIFKEFSNSQNDLLKELSKELHLDLNGQFESTEKETWRQTAINNAEKKKSRGVLVHRLQQNMTSSSVTVETNFLVKDITGKWFDAFRSQQTDDGSQAKEEELERMKNDPTLKQILPLLEAMGGSSQVKQALRQGAATASALGQARTAFSEFKNPYTRDLSSPPVPLTDAK